MGKKRKINDSQPKGNNKAHDPLIGRRVEKEFAGQGKFGGYITGFLPKFGFYKVVYDDGDKEELELHEVEDILVDSVPETPAPTSKKRRTTDKEPKSCTRSEQKRSTSTSKRQRKEPAPKTPDTKPNDVPVSATKSRPRPSRRKLNDEETTLDSSNSKEPNTSDVNCTVGAETVPQSTPKALKSRRQVFSEESEKPTTSARKNAKKESEKPDLSEEDDDEEDEEDVSSDVDESSDYEAEESKEEEDHDDLLSYSSSDEAPSRARSKQPPDVKLPEIVPMPDSSVEFALAEDLVADIFAIYSFLRSFSLVLFLSPFSLQDFAYGLICEAPNNLMDSIHLVLLQALRRHLHRLSDDGKIEAKECLRERDWNMLDNVTWPSFLVVFLHTQKFGLLYGQRLSSLGLLDVEYYKVPLKTKLNVLSFLCDQVMETEEIRAVIDAREWEYTSNSKQRDKNIVSKLEQSIRNQGHHPDMAKDDTFTRTEQLSASSDSNSDECVLCGMAGNLLCCDGCPAAYHSRCVGTSKASLPPGEWFCPECVIERSGEHCKRVDGLTGGRKLGIDPYGRSYIVTCGYLLVIEASDFMQCSYKYYKKDDIPGVLQSLDVLKPYCNKVSKAIREYWEIPDLSSVTSEDGHSLSNIHDSVVVCEQHSSQDMQISLDPEQTSQNLPKSDIGQLTVSGNGKVVETAPVKMYSDVFSSQLDAQDSVSLPSISEPSVNNLRSASPVLQSFPPDQPGCDINPASASDYEIKPLVEPVSNVPSEIVEKLSEASSVLIASSQDIKTVIDCENKPILACSQEIVAIVNCETKPNLEQTSTVLSDNVENLSGGSVDFVVSSHGHNLITAESQTVPKTEGVEITLSSHSFQGFVSNPSLGTSNDAQKWGNQGSVLLEDVQKIDQKSHSEGLLSPSFVRGMTITEKTHVGDVPDLAVKGRPMTPLLPHVCYQGPMSYVNLYALGDAAATAAANLTMLSGDRNIALKSKKITINSTIAEQLNAFQKAPSRFYWPSTRKRLLELPKERCGWCYSCTSNMKRGCLLNQVASQLAAGAAAAPSTIRPTKSGDGHLPAVAGYILYIEDVIQNFLQGPWENIHFRKFWRKKLEHAASVSELKSALLDLESNLRHVVLSEDWSKRSEDAPSLIMVACTASLLNESIVRKASNRKRNQRPTTSKRGSKTTQSALGNILWIRRGKVAHRVSGWATLSNEVLRKAARRGGLKKISGITYLEGDEVSKRSKQCAWRARVQASVTISELALHVRCLDALFRWNDLIPRKTDENENADNRTPVHAKTCKGLTYSYLVDSAIIQAHGSRQNAPNHKPAAKDHEIWVDERQVPLFLLKDYEEHERQSNQNKAPKLAELQKRYFEVKRSVKTNIFKHLFEKDSLPAATKLVISLTCKLCKQKVPASMAVQCSLCKEPFHEDCTIPSELEGCSEPQYSCSACLLSAACQAPKNQRAPYAFSFRSQSPHILNSVSHTETPNIPQYETPTLSLFEIPTVSRTEKLTISRSQSPTVSLNEKPTVSHNQTTKVFSHPIISQTPARSSNATPKNTDKNGSTNVYWRKFEAPSRMCLRNNLLFPIEEVCATESPKCFICQKDHMANVLYVKCERCPLWFHGESVGINKNNVGQVLGFKCHKCRKKGVPECPYGAKAKKQFRREAMMPCNTDLTYQPVYRPPSEDVYRAKRTPLLTVGNPAQNIVAPASYVGNPAQNVVSPTAYVGNPSQNIVSPASYTVKHETRDYFIGNNLSDVQPPVENPFNSDVPMMHQTMQGQYHLENTTEYGADEFQNYMQGSVEELPATVGDCEVGCISTGIVQELSRTVDNTNADMGVTQGSGSFEGGNLSKLSFSFTELLSSEDDRVEQLAGFPVMDVDNDGFDVFDVDTLMGSYGGSSVCPDATVTSGYSMQTAAVEEVDIGQNVSAVCAVCYDGCVPCDVHCIGCGITIHQQCLSAPIASGIWTCNGWACSNCKSGFIQDQDGAM